MTIIKHLRNRSHMQSAFKNVPVMEKALTGAFTFTHKEIGTLVLLVLLLSKLVLLPRVCLCVPSVATCDGGTIDHFRK